MEKIDFSDGLIEKKSPEALYLAQELYEKMETFFEKDDFEVLVGNKTRSEISSRTGLDYDTYRKRLYRKRLDFIQELDNED